jgi:hypothetical protein
VLTALHERSTPGRNVDDLAMMPRAVLVEGTGGYHRVLTAGELAALVAVAARPRQAGDDAP